ncbi:MAG: DnaD domain protein [Acholeplasmatales bacterium]|nr:DnaD domain protein [Acholeplasmatales bacterium]
MATKSVDSKSKFNIYSSFTLSNDDVAVISLLYTPLMGSDALMVYLAFCSLLERNNMKSEDVIHQDLFDIYSIKPNEFMKARTKLEAIGLLNTYYKDNSYIYVVCPPLTAKNFIKDATLGLYLYSNIRKETFDYIYNHFKIEKFEKSNYENITKSFDEVFDSQINTDYTFDKFKYILGKKPNKNIKIKQYTLDFDSFVKNINKDFLEIGITKNFKDQICNLAFVYGFDENEMIGLFNDSINKSGLYDYRLLKKKANILFNYKRNMKAPKLVAKNEEEFIVKNEELINYLENASPSIILEDLIPNYPVKYLDIVNEIISNINLPKGVLNCMIMKVIKEKSGELPAFNYFKKVSESWIKDNVFSTIDAIKYITTLVESDKKEATNAKNNDNGGFKEL